jgi:carboxypeptidase Taq
MDERLQKLKTLLVEANDVESAAALLYWDQATYMPACGAPGRARQSATLGRIAHEKFTDPAVGKLLDGLAAYEKDLPYASDDAGLIRVTRREYEKAVKVPPAFTAKLYQHVAESYDAWVRARPSNNFKAVQPFLEKTLALSREFVDFFPGYEHIADPLIDYADFGMKVSILRTIFKELREQLVPLVESISSQAPADDACLKQDFPEDLQMEFVKGVIEQMGYDLTRGRIDKTAHPFMTKFSLGDVRITTRVKEHDLTELVFSTIHEAGHAMYEQGINIDYEGTPLGSGASAGVHESQSRLWENFVGRSREFWTHFYPQLQMTFPEQLNSVSLDTFYRAINKVERSLIRTDADEVTYNLHVIIRFDLELQLLEGTLSVAELPAAWNARYKSDLGIEPPDDADGVMQDMHWYGGLIGGAFQGYTLGNLIGAQFYAAALKAHPEIPTEMASGKFETLRRWLRDSVTTHGRKYTASELVESATGDRISVTPLMEYLRHKYGELYSL